MQTVTGCIDRRPADVLANLIAALAADGLVDDQTGRAGGIANVTDSGNASGGDGGGNQPLVTCEGRHGLDPGDTVTLTGTGGYDGTFQVEPSGDPWAFLLDNVPYTADASGGRWS